MCDRTETSPYPWHRTRRERHPATSVPVPELAKEPAMSKLRKTLLSIVAVLIVVVIVLAVI